MKFFRKGEKGFTLIELLIVVAILGVLAAVIIPNVGRFLGRGQDEARKTEKRNLETAVINLMVENNLTAIPNPITGGVGDLPTNLMYAFPDDTSTTVDKKTAPNGTDYTWPPGDQIGYVLYQHDKTPEGDTSELHNYVNFNQTTFFYSVDPDGTVHQYVDEDKTVNSDTDANGEYVD